MGYEGKGEQCCLLVTLVVVVVVVFIVVVAVVVVVVVVVVGGGGGGGGGGVVGTHSWDNISLICFSQGCCSLYRWHEDIFTFVGTDLFL